MKTVTIVWQGARDFDVLKGPCGDLAPKEQMLLALARCGGLTALSLFEKMHLELSAFAVEASGELTEPTEMAYSTFDRFTVRYTASCADPAQEGKIAHAIRLTEDKYCGVGQMMKKIAPLEFSVVVNDTAIEY